MTTKDPIVETFDDWASGRVRIDVWALPNDLAEYLLGMAEEAGVGG